MKNKIIVAQIAFSLLAVSTFIGCDDEEYKEVPVTAVKSLYTPENEKHLELNPNASVYFEWEKASAQDNGVVYYDVIFDKEGGDFSNPIYIVTSDNKGLSTGATITHKILNKVGDFAGIQSASTGIIKWTIMSSRGLSRSISKEVRTLSITRLSGIDAPSAFYITGEGSEGGTDVSKAQLFKRVSQTEFEVFTKLTAGKDYHLISNIDPTKSDSYYIGDDAKIKVGEGSSKVSKTGVYWIYVDCTAGTVVVREVTKVGVWFCPNNTIIMDLPYDANAHWKGEGHVEFKQEGWGRDERYKFRMDYIEGGNTTTVEWVPTIPGLDGRPGGQEDYFNMKLSTSISQWDNKWKFDGAMDMADVRVDFYLQGDKAYYHSVTKK